MAYRKRPGELPVYLIYILLFLVTVSYPFFWDTIQLASKHATYFYNTDFRNIILPNEIDSGHIPSLGIYLAAVWRITGRTLIASHVAMLPFVIGIVYQSLKLTRRLFPGSWYIPAAIIILADPTIMAQSTLVSPDVALCFFFLLAINSILGSKRLLLMVALAGLALVSMRGMLCAAILYIAEVAMACLSFKNEKGKYFPDGWAGGLFRKMIPYLPAGFLAFSFFSWHYFKTGWIGHHDNMPWAPLFERTSPGESLFNVFILGWRLIDFGRLFIWITGAICLWHFYRKRPQLTADIKLVLIVFVLLLTVFGWILITHKNLSGHRYLIPVYLMFTISVLYYLINMANTVLPKKILAGLMIAGLLSGNFWVYPDRISKGWDASLAYLPYFSLRDKMIGYMSENNIKISDTGTGFPNEGIFDYTDLNGNKNSFAIRSFQSNRYILWSNVFNDFSDEELDSLKNWEKVCELRSLQVKMALYKNPALK